MKWSRETNLLRNRKLRRERVLQKMQSLRDAKARKRLANPSEDEPGMVRNFPLEIGIRDTRTGESGWVPLRSARFAHRLASVMFRNYLTNEIHFA